MSVSGCRRPIIFDAAVTDADNPLRMLSDCQIVRHDDDRDAQSVQILEHPQDLFAGARVEVSGRLVGEQERRTIDERPRDGHALLLTAGHLARLVVHALAKSHFFQQFAPFEDFPPARGSWSASR